MKGLKEKIRLIYVPFLMIAVGFVIVYTFLHWLLLIKTEMISLREDVAIIWLPLILPWIPVLIWLRPRIKLLTFKNDNGSFGFQVLAAFVIAGPTFFAQEYLVRATGKLTPLENISQLEKNAPTKYYGLKNYFIDKKDIGFASSATVRGKSNQDLNYGIYVVMPIFDSQADTAKGTALYWLGKKYSETISNRLSEQEKDEKYRSFLKKVEAEFDTTDFQNFTYLEKIGNTEDHDRFKEATGRSNLVAPNKPIIFTLSTTSFAERTGEKLGWIFKSFGIGYTVFFILLLFVPLQEEALDKFKTGIKPKDSDIKEILSLFIPRKGFFITPLVFDINILVYLVMVFAGLGFISFSAPDLLNWGGNYRPSTINGQYWRLLTSVFLHGGLIHLVANMAGFLFVGVFLEPILGSKMYVFVYLLTGILGSCASLWWHPATVSVGASGAIFGLYGLLLALLLLKVFPPDFGKIFLTSTLVFIGYNLLMGFASTGIDNAAHIGGLVSGFIIGIILSRSLKKEIAVP